MITKDYLVNEIYTKIYSKLRENYIVIFLCGGASRVGYKSMRDRVRDLLEKEKSLWGKKVYKVFYPEDLLIEVLNTRREKDLLSCERFLADNSHVIVIICESPGSFVELGAFTNNQLTENKVIAAVEKRWTKDKSFIMLGPVKYLKKNYKNSFVEYTLDEEDFAKKLSSTIKKKVSSYGADYPIDIRTIVGMHYFIQLLIYYFKSIRTKELAEMVKYILDKCPYEVEDFNMLYVAALKLLFQEKKMIKTTEGEGAVYELTALGNKNMKEMLSKCTCSAECDKIRVQIMYNEFYKSPHS